MNNFGLIDDLTRKLSEALPPGLNQAREDMESHIRSVLNGAFERMDLVTREQFESQTSVLERLQKKLLELEQQLAELQTGANNE